MEENGKLVSFIFRGDEVIVEETKEEKIRFIRTGELLASDAESARTYYHYASDEMGSITDIVDEESILNHYEYDAWGLRTVCEEGVWNRFLFYGQQYDRISQQYYLRARFYNPVMGRFTQEDSYRGDGLNLYSYCANNPVYYTDPSGHTCKKVSGDIQNKIAATSSQNLTVRPAPSVMNMIPQAALRQRYIQRRAEALQSVPVTHMMRITGTYPYAVQVMCSRTIMMRKGSGMRSRRTGRQRTSCTGTACL